MSLAKTFTMVGVSTGADGVQAVRYTNEKHRARVLEKNGHTDVFFITLGEAMRQEDAMDVLMSYVEDNEQMQMLEAVREEAARLGFVV